MPKVAAWLDTDMCLLMHGKLRAGCYSGPSKTLRLSGAASSNRSDGNALQSTLRNASSQHLSCAALYGMALLSVLVEYIESAFSQTCGQNNEMAGKNQQNQASKPCHTTDV